MSEAAPDNVARVRLRMYHSDLINGVYHGRVFEIFEEARTEVFRRLGFTYREVEAAGHAMVATAVSARFHAAARFDDQLLVGVFIDALRKAQVSIAYEARRERDGVLLFSGETRFAFVERRGSRLVRVPHGIQEAVRRCPAMLRAKESA